MHRQMIIHHHTQFGKNVQETSCGRNQTHEQDDRRKDGNMGLYVHRNHYGLLGTGKLGGGGVGNFMSSTYSLYCHHQIDSALRWAAV